MPVKAIKVVEIETLDARSLMNEVRLFARRRHVILTQPVWSRRSVAIDPNFIFFAGSDEARGCLQSICRDDLNIMYDVIANECKASGIKLIRGDMTD